MKLKEHLQRITDEKTLQLLEQYLPQASAVQRDGVWVYDKGLTNREYIEEVERLVRGLQKIMANKGTFEAAFKSISLAIKRLPEKDLEALPTYDKELTLLAMRPENVFRNVFTDKLNSLKFYKKPLDRQIIANQLCKIVKSYRRGLQKVGSGNANSQARKYIPGISYLAKRWIETLPGEPISSRIDSLFYLYVLHWLEYYEEKAVTPGRHIKNAIADMKTWRTLK